MLAAPSALGPLVDLLGDGWELQPAAPLAPLPTPSQAPDVAVNLHGRGPQSHRVLLALRPARLVAFAHPEVDATAGGPRWRAGEHEVARWCRLLRESAIPADPARLELDPPAAIPGPAEVASSAAVARSLPDARGAPLVHPGSAVAEKRWPAARFAAVARAERDEGRRVLVTGGPDEVALAQTVAARASLPPEAVLAGRTDLRALALLVSRAGRVVCGDTGLAHLATAFRTPSVVIFGPVAPGLWGPPPRPEHRVLWRATAGGTAGAGAAPHPALLAVEVDDVLAALAELPGTRRARPGAP